MLPCADVASFYLILPEKELGCSQTWCSKPFFFPCRQGLVFSPPSNPLGQLARCWSGFTHSRNGSSCYDLSCLKAFQQAPMLDWKSSSNRIKQLALAFQDSTENQPGQDLQRPGCSLLFPCNWSQNPWLSPFSRLHEFSGCSDGSWRGDRPHSLWLFHFCWSIL